MISRPYLYSEGSTYVSQGFEYLGIFQVPLSPTKCIASKDYQMLNQATCMQEFIIFCRQ
jgi:hypothetical protein